MSKKALITGGAGFIGSHLAELLAGEGWEVRILDNLSSGSTANLSHLRNNIELITGDIRDQNTCLLACKGMDVVFHLAAIASVVRSVEDPALSHDVTLTGTLNMLLAARDSGVRRFVFSSSSAVYGNAEISPTSEDQPIMPESPYAIDKAAGEMYCRSFYKLFGLETVILRYFNVFGPRQSATSGYAAVIPLFTAAALAGNSPTIYGDGLQTRDFVCVTNIVRANLLAATVKDAPGQTFNIAGGDSISLIDLTNLLERISGRPLNPKFVPSRAGEVRHSLADITRAQNILGFETEVNVEEGLRLTFQAMQADNLQLV